MEFTSGDLVKRHFLRKAYKNMWENDTFARQRKQGPLGKGDY